jgi:hypothetical protein
MYVDSAAGSMLLQMFVLAVVVAVLLWLLGRVIRRR